MRKKVDATSGNITKLIFIYTIPLILSTILQNMFDIADKAILGNMAGSTAVASVGASGIVTSLIISGAVGLSTGTSIILARYIGQRDDKKIRHTIDTSLITGASLGILVAAAAFMFAPTFLTATNCPADCHDGALIYIRIYLSAAPATLLYNYGSAILRTLGDTQKPLLYITIAGIVNVVLNVILCLILPQKVMAVAIATAASKIISAFLVIRRLCHFEGTARLCIPKIRFNFTSFTQILRCGIPAAITQLVLPIGNLQIVSAINSFGVDAIAGNSAAISIHTIVSAFVSGFGIATTTFMGQNIGAKKTDRVKKSFWQLLGFNVFISGLLGVILYLTGRFWLGLILGFSSKAAIEFGMRRLFFVVLVVFISAANTVLSHALDAFGYPLFTSISNIAFTLLFRILWMQLIYPLNPVFDTIMLCFTVSWTLNLILYAGFFTVIYRRYTIKGICKKI